MGYPHRRVGLDPILANQAAARRIKAMIKPLRSGEKRIAIYGPTISTYAGHNRYSTQVHASSSSLSYCDQPPQPMQSAFSSSINLSPHPTPHPQPSSSFSSLSSIQREDSLFTPAPSEQCSVAHSGSPSLSATLHPQFHSSPSLSSSAFPLEQITSPATQIICDQIEPINVESSDEEDADVDDNSSDYYCIQAREDPGRYRTPTAQPAPPTAVTPTKEWKPEPSSQHSKAVAGPSHSQLLGSSSSQSSAASCATASTSLPVAIKAAVTVQEDKFVVSIPLSKFVVREHVKGWRAQLWEANKMGNDTSDPNIYVKVEATLLALKKALTDGSQLSIDMIYTPRGRGKRLDIPALLDLLSRNDFGIEHGIPPLVEEVYRECTRWRRMQVKEEQARKKAI
jgi:hypothetical protein